MAKPEQLIERLRAAMAGAAPAGWTRIEVKVWASVLSYQVRVTVWMTDGSTPAVGAPAGLTSTFQELREEMYEPDRGTWFSSRLVLVAPDRHEISFNFDEDPRWWPSLPPTVFSRDLEAFPRSDEHIPNWLRSMLAEAREFEQQLAEEGILRPSSIRTPGTTP